MKKYFAKEFLLKSAAFLIVALLSVITTKASVISYTKNANGVTFKLDKGLMNIKVCKADIIEVKYTIFDAFPAKNSLVVNNPWAGKIAFTVTEHSGQIIISTAKLSIG